MADHLVDRCANRLGVAPVVERTRITAGFDRQFVYKSVDLISGDSRSSRLTSPQKDLCGSGPSAAHSCEFFWGAHQRGPRRWRLTSEGVRRAFDCRGHTPSGTQQTRDHRRVRRLDKRWPRSAPFAFRHHTAPLRVWPAQAEFIAGTGLPIQQRKQAWFDRRSRRQW